MLLNGAIDIDQYYVDFKVDIVGKDERSLDIKDCVAFAVKNLGNVPVAIDNTVTLGVGECNTRSFPNYLGLRYGVNKPLNWLTNGVTDPDFRLELTRVYLIRKNVNGGVPNESN